MNALSGEQKLAELQGESSQLQFAFGHKSRAVVDPQFGQRARKHGQVMKIRAIIESEFGQRAW